MAFLIVQTGGTIDKDYPRSFGGYAFEIGEPAAPRVLKLGRVSFEYASCTVCRKDSQELTDADREKILQTCLEAKQKKILVTHGTDTMIQSALYLNKTAEKCEKIIIFTGAMKPEKFRDSDAQFNVGLAVGAMQVIEKPGAYVAMNGNVFHSSKVTRNRDTGIFCTI
ncbi:probable L-asparaginase periplasmic [Oscarella lobularis]|uniref:probable L-asparaginase periplasmic n=1 Tax=Oscarella lobularis TaxID=121494 RepID=UPI0033137CA6